MPSINRIRVNNVKYNFGTQEYDDFTMRLYGRNTLYDLANGGGKSVLMLLLMQCMLPNCTLDEKQPLEKLFRESCGNTTIHSLVEWKLDSRNVTDGFRYLTTGFCARKARDRAEDSERDVASVEYFNYCIFYQEYGKYDIVNLPLTEGENRMTYQAMKNYLHDLARRENRLKVFIFDRKGEYQRFIARYGIIESQWEIIRGINQTEGHVRAWFETHYRTTRRVVEDLLIEEIIEKANRVKTEQEESREDSSAKLLMDIRGQLRELAEKKKDINTFDHEAELLRLFRDRIQSFAGIYEEREDILSGLGGIYLTLDARHAGREEEMSRLQEKVTAAEAETEELRAYTERLKVAKLQQEYEEKKSEADRKEAYLNAELEKNRWEEQAVLQRRSELDFLALKEEEDKRELLLAEEQEARPAEIGPVVEGIRRYLEAEEKELTEKAEDAERKLEKLTDLEEADSRALMDAKIELAVLERDTAALQVERKELTDRREALRNGLSEVSLVPFPVRLEQCEKDEKETEGKILSLQQRIALSEEEEEKKEAEYQEKANRLAVMRQLLTFAEKERAGQAERAERIRELGRIYHAEEEDGVVAAGAGNAGVGLSNGAGSAEVGVSAGPGRRATDKIIEAIYRKLSADMTHLSELGQELRRLEKRREESREGRLIALSEGVDRVLGYIATRHGTSAMFGMDYLAQQPHEEKERLLGVFPELPYGIVARGYHELSEDTELARMELGGALVRIYDWDVLGGLTVDEEDEEESERPDFSVVQASKFFLSEETEKLLLNTLNDQMGNVKTERDYLQDAVNAEKKDLAFLYAEEKGHFSLTEEELQPREKEAAELCEAIRNGQQERLQMMRQLSEAEERLDTLRRDGAALKELIRLENKESGIIEQLKEQKGAKERLERILRERADSGEERTQKEEQLRSAAARHREALTVLHFTWQEQYAAYHVEGAAPAAGTRAELEARFRLWKQGEENAEELRLKRRLLRESVESGIARLRQGILDRRVDLEQLEEAYRKGELLPGDPEELSGRVEAYLARRSELAEEGKKLAVEKAAADRMQGGIQYAIQNYQDAFGEYEAVTMDPEEVIRAIPEAEQHKAAAKDKLKALREELKAFQRKSQEWDGLYREAGRLIERNRIDISKAVVREDGSDLQAEFEELLVRLDRNGKSLERAQSQMLRTRGQVSQSLMDLGAATLAVSVRDDAELPGDRQAAEDLAKRLSDMEQLILLERSRVEQGIRDMEKLKENFVEQCLERCLDVRTELEKLPQLSQIKMDGQMIRMVKLSVPYVKDEFLRERMAEHIDRIVTEADKRSSEEEQHRYLASELALKKLFGVIVTDMNKIHLQLYKRERIREQSRYLKYEEAVGSTGQSQGIYIQFLISVINYIAGMYAPQDAEELTKTIFIDNPFGAAKDIYIWEPIFALLNANHVQLIVPSRGATPEITGRFDVNYVLGQQMAEGKAITVVTRYSSRTEEELPEYQELSYEQETFDFI